MSRNVDSAIALVSSWLPLGLRIRLKLQRTETAYDAKEGKLPDVDRQVERAYYRHEVAPAPADNPQVQQVYAQLLNGGCFSSRSQELLHTQYHKREKTVSMMINNW